MKKNFADFGIIVRDGGPTEQKTTCPKCSQTRKKKNYPCLNVNTEKGIFNCWHCGWSGALGAPDYSAPSLKKSFRKPDYAAALAPPAESIEKWLAKRGITPEVVRRNNIGRVVTYFPQVEEERPAIAFPYFRGTEIVNVKYRSTEKHFRSESGCERVLYGLNDIAQSTIIVEGEIDKLSLEVAGFPNCVSVPDGAPAPESKSYETKFDFLGAPEIARCDQWIIAVDSDAPGMRLREELIRRLGPEKCQLVSWPDGSKDANDVLVNLGVDALIDCIKEARDLPIVGAHEVQDFAEDSQTFYEQGFPPGASTGWASLNANYTVLLGELSVLTGIPNSGKSEWLDALTMNLAEREGWRFGIYSPENYPIPLHIAKLAEKYVRKPFGRGATERMTASDWDRAQTWLQSHVYFVAPELPNLPEILSIARQLVLRKGIRGLVIDPWNEIDHSRPESLSETEYISQSLSLMRNFARTHGVHVWVVAHPTKLRKNLDGTYPVPTPYDIMGSSHWRAKADNCLAIWRDLEPDSSTPSAIEIHIQKVRRKFVGRIGAAKLIYDRVTGRYSDPPDVIEQRATRYQSM